MTGFDEHVRRSAGISGHPYDRVAGRDDSPLLRKLAAEAKAGTERATTPGARTVRTIMQMVRAFPGLDCPAASRLFTEADQAYRARADAADTLGVFESAGARYRARRLAHRLYIVTPDAEEE
jgi:hypothetical protein